MSGLADSGEQYDVRDADAYKRLVYGAPLAAPRWVCATCGSTAEEKPLAEKSRKRGDWYETSGVVDALVCGKCGPLAVKLVDTPEAA